MTQEKASQCLREIKVCDLAVLSLSWSPDGTRLAVGDKLGHISAWATEGRCLWMQKDNSENSENSEVNTVIWSPDGRTLASVEGGTLCLRQSEQGILIKHITRARENLISWSPDSHRIAGYLPTWLSTCRVELTDTIEDRPPNIIKKEFSNISSIVYSQNTCRIAIADCLGIYIWDEKEAITCLVDSKSNNWSLSLVWSPTDEFILASDAAGNIQRWDIKQKKCVQSFNSKTNKINSIAYHPQGTCFASASDNAQISLWSPEHNNPLTRFEHPGKVTSIHFSPDGTQLASASSDGTIRFWDIIPWMKGSKHKTISNPIYDYLCRQAATLGRKPQLQTKQELWIPQLDSAEDECLGVFRAGYGREFPCVAIDSSRQCLLGGSGDGRLQCWDLTSGNLKWQGDEKHENGILDIVLSSDQQRIATVSDGSQLIVWDGENGHHLLSIQKHGGKIFSVCWLDNDKQLTTASYDNSIRLWDSYKGTLLKKLSGHSGEVFGVAVSPDGRWLASGSKDKTVRIWDLQSYETILTLEIGNAVFDVAWSPNGHKLLITENISQSLSLWSIPEGKLFKRWKVRENCEFMAFSIWFPDGSVIAGAPNPDRRREIKKQEGIKFWDANSGEELACLPFPEKFAWRLAWSEYGAYLASSHEDKNAEEHLFRLWDTREWAGVQSQPQPQQLLTLPSDLALLPWKLAFLHRLNITPPLSLLVDLSELFSIQKAQADIQVLRQISSIQALRQLHWPAEAHLGLFTLLLDSIPFTEWAPPKGLGPDELYEQLPAYLAEVGEVQSGPSYLAAIQQNAQLITKEQINLLSILGPQTVANDPGLPLRLRNQAQKLPDLHPNQRQQLAARIHLQEGHQSSTGAGLGIEHVGASLQGNLNALLPSQLALPWDLFKQRYLRQELLYRARKGQSTPSLSPMVIILDVTPPNFGPIEGMTRLAAHILATTLLRANINSLLITTGETVRVHRISRQADIMEIWTERSVFSADIPQTLKVAQTLRRTLNQGANEAGIILLSHSWFGGTNSKYTNIPGLRALFVNYPEQQVTPAFGQYCEQYEVLDHKDFSHLPEVIGRLMG